MPEGGPEGGVKEKGMLDTWTHNGIHNQYHPQGKMN